ncbi:MAG: MBL fold metallo-hydrolase [Deltaproteobacteria bacterium]|nr:MBL fold metallo-hydrolase [Deltaproteobacteria bacterium]
MAALLFILSTAILVYFLQATYYTGPISDHFNGKRFFNSGEDQHEHNFSDVIKLYSTKRRAWNSEQQEIPKAYPTIDSTAKPSALIKITLIGHASILISIGDFKILTDPIFSERASPVQFIGPKRFHPPGIKFEDLPKIDLVLISHNHYDHLDLPTLKKLWLRDNPKIITALGNDTIIKSINKNIQVAAYDWDDCIEVKQNFEICLTPAKHWSARKLFDKGKALWSGFVIKSPAGNIYFAGDTGYGTGKYFKAIAEKYAPLKTALLPIGAYEPRWFMKHYHLNPEEALLVWQTLGRPLMIPIHDRVFQLSQESYNQPRLDLLDALQKLPETTDRVKYLAIGESIAI